MPIKYKPYCEDNMQTCYKLVNIDVSIMYQGLYQHVYSAACPFNNKNHYSLSGSKTL